MTSIAPGRSVPSEIAEPRFRSPRAEFWEDRRASASEVRGMIAALDPVEDDAEITHLSIEVLTPPMFAHAVYASGTARGMIHPAEAKAGYRGGTGEQLLYPEHRDRDTLTFFGLFIREGHRSERIQSILDRVQQIHHDVRGVGNDTQLHILALLMVEPARWTRDLGHPGWFTDNENEARFHFWTGIGRGMGLQGLFRSYDEAEQWALAFERKHFATSHEAREIYRGQVEGFRRWFPGQPRFVADQWLTAGLSRMTSDAVGAKRVLPGTRRAITAGMSALRAGDRARTVNLSRTWVSSFSRDGNDPDIAAIGYQHDVEGDARYRRAGHPSLGYEYTVAGGLRSADRSCPFHS